MLKTSLKREVFVLLMVISERSARIKIMNEKYAFTDTPGRRSIKLPRRYFGEADKNMPSYPIVLVDPRPAAGELQLEESAAPTTIESEK
jgi:hypothetical protein